jgi:hypothetical protein
MTKQNKKVVPNASAALDRMKFEVAQEIGVPLSEGYNGNLTAAQAGSIGGAMTRRLIQIAEQTIAQNGRH